VARGVQQPPIGSDLFGQVAAISAAPRPERTASGVIRDHWRSRLFDNRGVIVRLAACVVGALILAVAYAQASPVPHGSISSTVPVLRNTAALGTLVRLDTEAAMAEFRVKCGWHYSPRKKIRPGRWKVSLRRLTFGWETDLRNPAAPTAHVRSVSLRTWERLAGSQGWSGTLRLTAPTGNLSNGPTTDICVGILG
jgi:hypothetical protein